MQKLQNSNMENLINRLKSLGYTLNTFDTHCKHKCYIASSMDNLRHMFIIPDDVEYIYDDNGTSGAKDLEIHPLYNYLSNLRGELRVVGGSGLRSAHLLLCDCKANSIDIASLETSNVESMYGMFEGCKAHSINISSLNTDRVKNMGWMFFHCYAHLLDLSSFNTSNVTNMSHMFHWCQAQSLDLRSFDTSNVTDMSYMFFGVKQNP